MWVYVCYVMLCYAILCYVMLCYVTVCYAMLCMYVWVQLCLCVFVCVCVCVVRLCVCALCGVRSYTRMAQKGRGLFLYTNGSKRTGTVLIHEWLKKDWDGGSYTRMAQKGRGRFLHEGSYTRRFLYTKVLIHEGSYTRRFLYTRDYCSVTSQLIVQKLLNRVFIGKFGQIPITFALEIFVTCVQVPLFAACWMS